MTLAITTSPLQPSRLENMPAPAKFGNVGIGGAQPGEKQHPQQEQQQASSANTTKRVVSALAVQAGAKRGKRLSTVIANPNPSVVAVPSISMEVMNNNFEEWMKLATDNVSLSRNCDGDSPQLSCGYGD